MDDDRSRAIVRLAHVAKTYQSKNGEVVALDGVTLDIARGSFVSIVGRSGCGKSTLLKIIAGLLPVSDGCVLMDGREVQGPIDDLGMVFQTPVLLDWRNVLGNILLPAEILGVNGKKARERARELIDKVGLSGFETRYPYELSGGMQQRVSLCRALVSDPSLLLMDEPFGALDALTRDEMAVELLRLYETTGHKTIVFVTHSIDEAVLLADRVVVMSPRPGRIRTIVDIDIPRPRGIDVRYEARFARYSQVVRDAIYEA
jgi:NitT/TauT family transport system ATP-binding protein